MTLLSKFKCELSLEGSFFPPDTIPAPWCLLGVRILILLHGELRGSEAVHKEGVLS